MSTAASLSRRERQIMDILYQRGKASASEVREAMGYEPVCGFLDSRDERTTSR